MEKYNVEDIIKEIRSNAQPLKLIVPLYKEDDSEGKGIRHMGEVSTYIDKYGLRIIPKYTEEEIKQAPYYLDYLNNLIPKTIPDMYNDPRVEMYPGQVEEQKAKTEPAVELGREMAKAINDLSFNERLQTIKMIKTEMISKIKQERELLQRESTQINMRLKNLDELGELISSGDY